MPDKTAMIARMKRRAVVDRYYRAYLESDLKVLNEKASSSPDYKELRELWRNEGLSTTARDFLTNAWLKEQPKDDTADSDYDSEDYEDTVFI